MTRLRNFKTVVLLIVLVTAATLTTAPGDGAIPITTDALGMDAAIYAADWGISVTEAKRRLTLQDPAGVLNATLVANEAETFAGVSIQHGPEFRVIVYFTRNGDGSIRPYISGGPLAEIVETRTADVSFAALKQIQSEATSLVRGLGIPVESAINIRENRVEMYALNPSTLKAAVRNSGSQLPDKAEIVAVDQHSTEVADIYAGLQLDIDYSDGRAGICTSGFSVENSSGTKGITTARHCVDHMADDDISYNGTELSIQAGRYGSSWDVLWATAPGFTVRNLTFDGSGNRYITSTKSRSQISDNEYICKYGITTHHGCGYVEKYDL